MSGYRSTDKRVDDLLDEVCRLQAENEKLMAMLTQVPETV